MKKAVLKILVVIMAVCSMLAVFTACDNNAIEFRINFIADGEIYATVSTSGGETIKMPDNPEKEDYTFDGWFWDKDVWEKPFTANSLLDAPLSSDMSVYAKFTKKHEHNYTVSVTEPICTEKGYTTYTCACGESYKDDYVDELGHDYNATVTDPTCTEKGYTTHTCSRCQDSYIDTYTNALNHDYGDWILTKEPTCTETGIETRYCSHDNTHTEKRTVNARNHNYNAVVTKPTCTEKGYTTHTCSRCQDSYIDTYTDELGHEFTNYVYDNNATYDEDGTKTAVCNRGCGATNTVTAENTKLKSEIVFKTLSVDEELNVYGKVANTKATFSFINEVEVKGNATFVVSTDIYGMQQIPTKTVPIEIGDNTFYITETVGNNIRLFTVTVRRRPVYTVSFNTVGGSAVQPQYIEEDSLATEPTTTRAGYTFTGWNYDFTNPIIKNTTVTASWVYYTLTTGVNNDKAGTATVHNETKITVGESVTITATTNDGYTFNGWYDGDNLLTNELSYTFTMPNENLSYTAKWTANTNTKYLVEHYLEELDGSFTKQESDTVEKYGETDTLATVQTTDIKEYEHFTHATVSQSVESANLNGNESTVLKVYYTRNEYTIRLVAGDNVTLNKTYDNKYKYGYQIETITANYNEGYLGYDWKGWHNGDDVLTYDNTIPSFTVDKDMDFTADFTVKPEMLNYNFTSNTTECTITGIKDNTVTEIILPTYVTAIGDRAFYGCSGLTNMVIPENVTDIGQYAFSRCNRLTYIMIPDSVISIGNNAFDGCTNLAKTTIPDSVTSIGWATFYGCNSLTEVIIPDSITNIGGYAFYGCSNLTSITIPESVTSIGSYAFSSCSNLSKIYYTGSINEWVSKIDGLYSLIDYEIYINNEPLPNEIVLENITEIKPYAFYNFTSLTSITIPDSVTSIGSGAFSGCYSLESITIPFVGGSRKTASSTYQYPFGYIFGTSSYTGGTKTKQSYYGSSTSSITNITCYIPSTLKSVTVTGGDILYGAFYGCNSLTEVIIPDSITNIGGYAFYGCSNLTSITIPESVTSIGSYAFSGCSNLSKIYYTGSINEWVSKIDGLYSLIDYEIYINNEPLPNEIVLENITEIKSYAFYIFTSLTSITIPDSVTSIGSYAFSNCTCEIEWGDNPSITTIGNYAFSGYQGMSITIPDSVTSIGSYAFSNCTCEIEWGDNPSITTIGNYAFSGYQGMCITIPDSVTSIGYAAFGGCNHLVSITLPFVGSSRNISNEQPKTTSSGTGSVYVFGYIFGGKQMSSNSSTGNWTYQGASPYTTSKRVMYGNNIITEYTYYYDGYYIPVSLKKIIITSSSAISAYAFYGCNNITEIVLTCSISSIGNCAFYGCSNLTSVYYNGTEEDWAKVSIEYYYNLPLSSATRYYYSEIEPAEAGNYWHYAPDGITPVIWVKEN